MAMVRWMPGNPTGRGYWNELDTLRNQMMSLFDNLLSPERSGGLSRAGVFPPLNLYEDEDNFYVNAELPGIAPEALKVIVENDKLILRGERKSLEIGEKVNIHRQEREAGTFRRVVVLPAGIDAEKVSAVTRNGVVEITLPKAAEAKPRQIAIQAA